MRNINQSTPTQAKSKVNSGGMVGNEGVEWGLKLPVL